MPEHQEDWVRKMRMTSEERFFKFVQDRAPALAHLWDSENKCLNIRLVEKFYASGSSGERQIMLFFVAVWFGENEHDDLPGFNLMKAARVLDEHHLETIQIWLKAPFFP